MVGNEKFGMVFNSKPYLDKIQNGAFLHVEISKSTSFAEHFCYPAPSTTRAAAAATLHRV